MARCTWATRIISLALTEILDGVDAELEVRTDYRLAFKRGNDLERWRSGQAALQVFTAQDKRVHTAQNLDRMKSQRPIVIGHDDEDMGMVELAREMAGVSIGFAPPACEAPQFDFVVAGLSGTPRRFFLRK